MHIFHAFTCTAASPQLSLWSGNVCVRFRFESMSDGCVSETQTVHHFHSIQSGTENAYTIVYVHFFAQCGSIVSLSLALRPSSTTAFGGYCEPLRPSAPIRPSVHFTRQAGVLRSVLHTEHSYSASLESGAR